ncbi:MAG: YdeI/OmpD-associated family protein [Deltaproteobacteria bacterium]|nr:YdeI/OmpD-associated family protein [Deltaproteobacteria bacterium]
METRKGTTVPDDLALVLEADDQVRAVFEAMRPSCQREYVDWVSQAKKPETRANRLQSFSGRILDYGRRHQWIPD